MLIKAIVFEVSLAAALVGQELRIRALVRAGVPDVVAQHASIALEIGLKPARFLVQLSDDTHFLGRRNLGKTQLIVADFHRFKLIDPRLRIWCRESGWVNA